MADSDAEADLSGSGATMSRTRTFLLSERHSEGEFVALTL
jgi:hypothetical protein